MDQEGDQGRQPRIQTIVCQQGVSKLILTNNMLCKDHNIGIENTN